MQTWTTRRLALLLLPPEGKKTLCAGSVSAVSWTSSPECGKLAPLLRGTCHPGEWRRDPSYVTSSSSRNQMCAEPVTLLTVVPWTRTVHAKSFSRANEGVAFFLFLSLHTPLLSASCGGRGRHVALPYWPKASAVVYSEAVLLFFFSLLRVFSGQVRNLPSRMQSIVYALLGRPIYACR